MDSKRLASIQRNPGGIVLKAGFFENSGLYFAARDRGLSYHSIGKALGDPSFLERRESPFRKGSVLGELRYLYLPRSSCWDPLLIYVPFKRDLKTGEMIYSDEKAIPLSVGTRKIEWMHFLISGGRPEEFQGGTLYLPKRYLLSEPTTSSAGVQME